MPESLHYFPCACGAVVAEGFDGLFQADVGNRSYRSLTAEKTAKRLTNEFRGSIVCRSRADLVHNYRLAISLCIATLA